MASFKLRVAQNAPVADWEDPPMGQVTSRLNPEPGYPHMTHQAYVGSGVIVKATPNGGAEGAPDASLNSHFFTHWFSEHPAGSAGNALISVSPGLSSVASFVPDVPGNYVLVFCRDQGGSLALPIEVVRPPEE